MIELTLVSVGLSAFMGEKIAHGFQPSQSHRRKRCHRGQTHLHVVRRPLRPASTEKKLADRKAIIESLQSEALQDPTLLTDLSFSECKELHPNSKRALVEDMGLLSMTEVQAKTFAAALAGKDVLARARTGTGKTLAFLVPVVERILSNPTYLPGKTISCLVIAPTRELAIQIGQEAEKLLLHHSDLSVQVMYGGVAIARDINALNKRLPSILVATPGRLLDHLQETKIGRKKFNDDIVAYTNIVVLDEIDRLLDTGFRKEVQKILSYLPRKDKRQTMLFSATIPKGLRGVMRESMRDDFVEVDCVQNGTMTTSTNLRVSQSHVILPTMDSVIPSIYSLLKHATIEKPFKVVVFFPTARMVSFFANFLSDGLQHPIIELHSKKSQSSRNTASENFREAKSAILFTSDLSARGIDYPDVTHVIQIGVPESRDHFIHRLGRTARAGKGGTGLLVLFPFEAIFLSELRGLDVPPNSELTKMLQEPLDLASQLWSIQNSSRIQSGGNKLASTAQLACLSFLGYYLGQANRIRLNKTDIVKLSNDFSKSLGLAHMPTISGRLVSKMELNGVPGVFTDVEDV
jgi:ATP-dependent RNA helicase MSS116